MTVRKTYPLAQSTFWIYQHFLQRLILKNAVVPPLKEVHKLCSYAEGFLFTLPFLLPLILRGKGWNWLWGRGQSRHHEPFSRSRHQWLRICVGTLHMELYRPTYWREPSAQKRQHNSRLSGLAPDHLKVSLSGWHLPTVWPSHLSVVSFWKTQ